VNLELHKTAPEELLRAGAAELGLSLGPAVIQQFLVYLEKLLQWNTRMNLTGMKSAQEVVVKHFLDSLAVCPWLNTVNSLADIGTGAGFPGLPLKLALPQLHLTLVEPTGKKIAFLRYLIVLLGLQDVEVRPQYLTPALARQWGPSFQGVITRATFPLARFLELGGPLVRPGGRLLALKGPHLDEAQWQAAINQASLYGFGFPVREAYRLPLTHEPRLVVFWEKAPTSPAY